MIRSSGDESLGFVELEAYRAFRAFKGLGDHQPEYLQWGL